MKHKRMVLLLIGLVLTSLMVGTSVYAQSDADGDGVLDEDDHCPEVAGSPVNNGCPLVTMQGNTHTIVLPDTDDDGVPDSTDACPAIAGSPENNGCLVIVNIEPVQIIPNNPDSDGDGIVDSLDKCPSQGGFPDTDGCPVEEARPFTPFAIPVEGACSVVANHPEGVNVRETFTANAPVVGTLDPQQIYPVEAAYLVDGNVWYLVMEPAGFVLGDVVIVGGQCDALAQINVHRVPDTDPSTEVELVEAEDAYASPASTTFSEESASSNGDLVLGIAEPVGDLQPATDPTYEFKVCNVEYARDISLGSYVKIKPVAGSEEVKVYDDPFSLELSWTFEGTYDAIINSDPVCRIDELMWHLCVEVEKNRSYQCGWVFDYNIRPPSSLSLGSTE